MCVRFVAGCVCVCSVITVSHTMHVYTLPASGLDVHRRATVIVLMIGYMVIGHPEHVGLEPFT